MAVGVIAANFIRTCIVFELMGGIIGRVIIGGIGQFMVKSIVIEDDIINTVGELKVEVVEWCFILVHQVYEGL